MKKSHGKESQGANDNSPKLVTLERRKVREIKQACVPDSSTKTFTVEVRKKKTYIKHLETDEQKTVEPIQDFAEESNTPDEK